MCVNKTQRIISLYLKQTPLHSQHIVLKNFQSAQIHQHKQSSTNKLYCMMQRYINSLQTHRQYLQFFQIGVVRDNKQKIHNVARYVGLQIRGIDEHLRNDKIQNDITKKYSDKENNKKSNNNDNNNDNNDNNDKIV